MSDRRSKTLLAQALIDVTYSLDWILLRLVVAVRRSATSTLTTTASIGHGLRRLILLVTLVLLLLLLTITTLVVTSYTPRLVLGVLLLILIPAGATCGSWIAAALIVTLPIAVAAATLVVVTVAVTVIVAMMAPAVPLLVFLESLRVLS